MIINEPYRIVRLPTPVDEIENPGYHVTHIDRGECGDVSKIIEEALELQDAITQGVRIMQLVELSDLVQAIRMNLELHHPGFTLQDLIAMADVTQRAFANGHRKPR